MVSTGNKKFRSKAEQEAWEKTFVGMYSVGIKRHPFILFGLPFITLMVAGSFLMIPWTSVKFEHNDAKVKSVTAEDAFPKNRRKVDVREEYMRLQGLDLDNWEQKRVPRTAEEEELTKWGG